MAKTKSTKPQTTLVTVAVTTAGPVPMVRVREAISATLHEWLDGDEIGGRAVTHVTVKRDANIERPRR